VTDVPAQLEKLRNHGWRQGSVLPASVVEAARVRADGQWPSSILVGPDDWLIIISHSCDVRNRNSNPDNEPFVEVLVARKYPEKKADSRETYGKSSRRIHFEGEQSGTTVRLVALAYERFRISRFLLVDAPPDGERIVGHPVPGAPGKLDGTIQTVLAWVTKRYQRQAFPDAFDMAARPAKDAVDGYLKKHAQVILGAWVAWVERPDRTPRFRADFRIVIKSDFVAEDWAKQQDALETAFLACWTAAAGIEVDVVAVQARRFSLGEISEGGFKKFDKDWISYEFDPDGGPAPEV